ncbi:MAG: hypothetical protein KKF30_11055 [Proteobacteria bacterium]|nr:hypothetical protein [Pseudomonadota bacterium]MBU4469020.1 hypothetical protein [Pseudomonadota bacterium]MCG2750959.1 hypothetical protein [Desulfobacteraceae bacterium]
MNKHEIIWEYVKIISKHGIIISVAILFIYKGIDINLGIKADSLEVSDILSLLLAFFAVALSVFFYFKSSEESSRFYENSYKFTMEMSVLLGKIESGFGEKLNNINEGNNVIRRSFEILSLERESTQKELDKEKNQLDATVKEKETIISDLVEKSDQKQEILTNLREKDEKINEYNLRLSRYQLKLMDLENKINKYDDTSMGNLNSNINALLRDSETSKILKSPEIPLRKYDPMYGLPMHGLRGPVPKKPTSEK